MEIFMFNMHTALKKNALFKKNMYVYSKSVLSTYLLKKNVYFYIEKKNKITKKKKKKKGDFKNSNYNISFKKILRFSIDD